MKALITGITGFAGSHLADYCLERGGVEVCGIVRWRSRTENIEHLQGKIALLECDLRDATSTREIIEGIRPDYIFHLAAQSFVPTSWRAPTECLVTNVIGQLNIFEAVRKTNLKPRIQIACSSEEYGMTHEDELPITEDTPLRPLSPYGVSKVGQDLLAYQYFMSYQMDVVRTRGFNHTGPRRAPVFVVSDFSKQIADIEKGRKDPVIRVGNLDAERDFTDVRDIVRAYFLALEKGKSGEAYNICSEKSWRIGDMLEKLLSHSRAKIRIQEDPARLRPSDVPRLRGDCSKFRRDTGWTPRIPFEQTLKDMLEYWRAR
jgi:GDP-4-dehydro-6-deoxy-D-mannose reductase